MTPSVICPRVGKQMRNEKDEAESEKSRVREQRAELENCLVVTMADVAALNYSSHKPTKKICW